MHQHDPATAMTYWLAVALVLWTIPAFARPQPARLDPARITVREWQLVSPDGKIMAKDLDRVQCSRWPQLIAKYRDVKCVKQ